jgi:glycosyltransferase involved in cell wall biosynthesis
LTVRPPDTDTLVTVVLATNECSRFLGPTLASVRAQSYPFWELILVDDGSPDPARLDVAASVDKRIRVVHRPHEGVSAARNTGLADAGGALIAFLDHDDTWEPDHLTSSVQALASNPEAVAAFGPVNYIDEGGRQIGRSEIGPVTRRSILLGEARPEIVTLLVRVDVAGTGGGFDTTLHLAEDIDFIHRLADCGSFVSTGRPTVNYRRHANNVSGDTKRTAIGNDIALARNIARHRAAGQSVETRWVKDNRRRARRFYAGAVLGDAGRAFRSGDRRRSAHLFLWSLRFSPSGAVARRIGAVRRRL